jgi:CHASE2 domain-containing sensor protein
VVTAELPKPSGKLPGKPRRIIVLPPEKITAWMRLTITAAVVAFAVYGFRSVHGLEGFESRWLDLMAYVDRPAFKVPVHVVTITEDDFRSPALFGGLSPLHPDGTARLIQRVSEHRPLGAILDIQIHPSPYEPPDRVAARLRLYRTIDSLARHAPEHWVLVRDLEAEKTTDGIPISLRIAWEKLKNEPRLTWADPAIGYGGVVVRALPLVSTPPGSAEPWPTVLGAAIQAFQLKPYRKGVQLGVEGVRPAGPWQIRYTGRFLEDTSTVSSIRSTATSLLMAPVVPAQQSLLTGRVVLIGGDYREGRDVHLTPVGEMAGVFVWAEAIASWLRHDALQEPPAYVEIILEILIGVLAGLMLLRSGPGWGLLYSCFGIIPLAVLFSILSFGDRVLFVNFLPSFLAVYLHYQIELHIMINTNRRLVQSLGQENHDLREQVAARKARRTTRQKPATD